MSTTIALKDQTYNLLRLMKEELNTSTFDETIDKMILSIKRPSYSIRGRCKGLKPFVRDQIDRFDR
jgi:hypothetical protein